jgi:hypothetical protein
MYITGVKYLRSYILQVAFKHGLVKDFNFKDFLFTETNPMFTKFRNLSLFKKMRAENGLLIWVDDEMDFLGEHLFLLEKESKRDRNKHLADI